MQPTSPADPADDPLDRFLDWTIERGFDLYPAQEEAVLELFEGKHVVLATPTGSGKSLVALAQHFRGLQRGERSFYTSPIKALVSEKFFALCRDLGADNVGMLTGDASINRDAPVICCTAEVLANMALRQGGRAPVDHVCMDEFHYYADRDRGMAWQLPLLTLPDASFLLMSATLGDTSAIERELKARTGRDVAVVSSEDRPVPLSFHYSEEPIHEAVAELLRTDKAPIYLVNSSQRDAAEQAQSLMSVGIADKPGKRAIAAEIGDFRFDSAYGQVVQRHVRHGVGLHHAGLLPKYRLLVERLAQKGLLKVISGTDTLGVGINVPLRTVLLTRLSKFDGERVRLLSVREFKQIAGRAGRKGFDDQGWVVAQAPEHVIENRRLAAKAAMSASKGGKAKKFVRRKPPQRGWVPYNQQSFERLVGGRSEALQSVFRIDHGILMSMLHHEDGATEGLRRLVGLIGSCHERPAVKLHLRRDLARLFRALVQAGVVELVKRPDVYGRNVELAGGLQRDFSLHHSLSLFLVHALGELDKVDLGEGEHAEQERALRVITLVESILENPRQVLQAQVHRAKGELVARLKAEGVEYEERMEKLEGVTWPKPDAEWIYATFNAFSDGQPWLEQDNIRPKSIARELLERYCGFDDYVREYGIARFEGVLLRYLSQVYKTLLQNVPERYHDEALVEHIAGLRALLARVDSSLVQHWEALRGGKAQSVEELATADKAPPPIDLAKDQRALRARIRAELHALVRALSRRDWAEAAACVRRDGDHGWAEADFEAALADFHASFGDVRFDHAARLADKTAMHAAGPRRWEVSQALPGPLEPHADDDDDDPTAQPDDDWGLHAVVDLGADAAPSDGPLLALQRIGV